VSRPFGSRNRTKIPQSSEIIKYAGQNLRDTLIFLEGIINSSDPSVSVKNKLDASELNRKILEMSGYGKELGAGLDKIIDEEGEPNKFRQTTDPVFTNAPATSAEVEEAEDNTPNLDSMLFRFDGNEE
jgi:hypothetical protein